MRIVLIEEDDSEVLEFSSVAKLEKRLNVEPHVRKARRAIKKDIETNGTAYCWVCPYNEDIWGKRLLQYTFDLESAREQRENAAWDI